MTRRRMMFHVLLLFLLSLSLSLDTSTAYQRIPSKTTTSSTSNTPYTSPSISTYTHSTLYHIKPYHNHIYDREIATEHHHKIHKIHKRIQLYQRIFHNYQCTQSNRSPLSSLTALFSTKQNDPNARAVSDSTVSLSIPMGAGYESLTFKLKPLFKKSKFLVVTYPIPFDLNLERPPKGFPAPVVSRDNAERDEQKELEGDVLRGATAWSQSYLTGNGGWTSDIVNVAGNIRWKRAVFDTTGAPWEQVVKALQSNAERSEEVTLIFERAIDTDSEEEEK